MLSIWPFKFAKNLEPALSVPRDHELLTELRQIDSQLAQLEKAALALRQKHSLRVNQFGQITSMQADLSQHAVVEREWRMLLKRRDPLFAKRNRVLLEWSELRKANNTA